MTDAVLKLETFLPYRFNRLAEAVSRDFSRLYREKFGLTRPEWRLLATLGQYGSMTATQVGRHSSMHKTKVSRAVTALENRRWLKREPYTSDRRIEHLQLTQSGQRAYREIVPLAHDYERDLLARMSESEREAVLAAFATFERVALKQ